MMAGVPHSSSVRIPHANGGTMTRYVAASSIWIVTGIIGAVSVPILQIIAMALRGVSPFLTAYWTPGPLAVLLFVAGLLPLLVLGVVTGALAGAAHAVLASNGAPKTVTYAAPGGVLAVGMVLAFSDGMLPEDVFAVVGYVVPLSAAVALTVITHLLWGRITLETDHRPTVDERSGPERAHPARGRLGEGSPVIPRQAAEGEK